MNRTQELYKKAKLLIPGGTQLLSKRPELFLPEGWPAYYNSAAGCKIEDLDGNIFTDMVTMGIGTCVLGYADEDVNNAVINVINSGNMSSLNSPEEVSLAKLLIDLHPWSQMVRFVRTGGEAMAVAVRIGRAKTKKDKVLFCGYHGWHDWYLASNLSHDEALDGHLLPGLEPLGVPRKLQDTSIPFKYNDTAEFLTLIKKFKGEVGVIVLEAIRSENPTKEFINTIQEVARKENIVFVVDEITSGWRLNLGGAHLLFGIEPDIAVFAKGISNGYPMGAIIGKAATMQSAQDTFISSTYWTERIGPAAAIATINKMKTLSVQNHLVKIGEMVQSGWKNHAASSNIAIEVSGIYPLSHFIFKEKEPLKLKTIFTKLMLDRGFLASTVFYASLAHKENHVKNYLTAVDEVFNEISKAISRNALSELLSTPVCHSGFKRLT